MAFVLVNFSWAFRADRKIPNVANWVTDEVHARTPGEPRAVLQASSPSRPLHPPHRCPSWWCPGALRPRWPTPWPPLPSAGSEWSRRFCCSGWSPARLAIGNPGRFSKAGGRRRQKRGQGWFGCHSRKRLGCQGNPSPTGHSAEPLCSSRGPSRVTMSPLRATNCVCLTALPLWDLQVGWLQGCTGASEQWEPERALKNVCWGLKAHPNSRMRLYWTHFPGFRCIHLPASEVIFLHAAECLSPVAADVITRSWNALC